MSFVVKDHDINLLVSIVTATEDDNHTILATNFKRYFIEKNVNNEVLEERMSVSCNSYYNKPIFNSKNL